MISGFETKPGSCVEPTLVESESDALVGIGVELPPDVLVVLVGFVLVASEGSPVLTELSPGTSRKLQARSVPANIQMEIWSSRDVCGELMRPYTISSTVSFAPNFDGAIWNQM